MLNNKSNKNLLNLNCERFIKGGITINILIQLFSKLLNYQLRTLMGRFERTIPYPSIHRLPALITAHYSAITPYLHSPGFSQYPWLDRQSEAQIGSEQNMPFHPGSHEHSKLTLQLKVRIQSFRSIFFTDREISRGNKGSLNAFKVHVIKVSTK